MALMFSDDESEMKHGIDAWADFCDQAKTGRKSHTKVDAKFPNGPRIFNGNSKYPQEYLKDTRTVPLQSAKGFGGDLPGPPKNIPGSSFGHSTSGQGLFNIYATHNWFMHVFVRRRGL